MNEDHIQAAKQAIQYMKMHLDHDLTSEQLAAHVGYSHYHFTRVFKRVTGISPRHYLSALRIEAGKHHLLRETSLLVKILHSIGFQSAGSFNSRFKQQVGISPQKFRTTSKQLFHHMNEWEHKQLAPSADVEAPSRLSRLTCQIITPPSFRGMIFVGLFPRPIPDQRPIRGTAINQNSHGCTFTNIPPGMYYVMAAGIAWSIHPRDYFLLNQALRGIHEDPVQIEQETKLDITITLREPLPQDPPIIINLPMLLYEQNKQKSAK